MHRRSFLRAGVATGAALTLGPSFWHRVFAGPAASAALQPPDANGLRLWPGFTSQVVARGNHPVGTTGYVWRQWPDGAAAFPVPDEAGGGWVLAQNSEVPLAGGVDVIRFAPDGTIIGAYPILAGTSLNCAGGATPWGTWLSCEEWDGGLVWECKPLAPGQGIARPALGSFKHEAAAVDPRPDRGHVYLTEDQTDGCLYRFSPAAPEKLDAGLLEVLVLEGGEHRWVPVPNPNPLSLPEQKRYGGAPQTPTRYQVPSAVAFDGGEGCHVHEGVVYFTTKGDHRVWALDADAMSLRVLYDGVASGGPLRGVDNLLVTSDGTIFVAEDGDDMQVCIVQPDGTAIPFLEMTGPAHQGWPVPEGLRDNEVGETAAKPSEVTGLTFDPDGKRLYCSSQRGDRWGITYEITGPFSSVSARLG